MYTPRKRTCAARVLQAALWAFLSGCALPLLAQQEPAFAHYWELEPQFNPAAAGRDDRLSISAAVQTHASGFDDAGSTMYAGADVALQFGRTRHGLGAAFLNDAIGLFAHKRFSLLYSYHFRLWGGRFSVGASADMLSETVDGSKADLADANDPAIPSGEVSGAKIDASFGLGYARGPIALGLSCQHALAPTVLLGETHEIAVKRVFNFTAAYNIRLKNPLFSIVPSAMLRYDGADMRGDFTARFVCQRENRRLYGGASYSPLHSVTAFVGGTFHGIDLSYSYEASTEGLGMNAGFHEVTVGYRLDLNFGKRGRNAHRSVRWL